jgi:hypothetical protein
MTTDYSPTGLKYEGPYENDRNTKNADLFKAIIREVYGVQDVIIGHHLVYEVGDKEGGFIIQVVEEIPSADALIFDHEAAKKLWGKDYMIVLQHLACVPPERREAALRIMYNNRPVKAASTEQVTKLADQLKAAEAAHAQHEKEIGHADANWPEFYASWILAHP